MTTTLKDLALGILETKSPSDQQLQDIAVAAIMEASERDMSTEPEPDQMLELRALAFQVCTNGFDDAQLVRLEELLELIEAVLA